MHMNAKLDHIVIDDGDLPDARSRQRRNDRAANATGADDGNACVTKPALPEAPDLRQDDVSRVALELLIGQAHCPVEPKPPAPRLVSPRVSTARKAAF